MIQQLKKKVETAFAQENVQPVSPKKYMIFE